MSIYVILIDRFAPTSKLCSVCGVIKDDMTLATREWDCTCGAHHDRDVNAAQNILAFATGERPGSRRVEGDTKLEGLGTSLNLKAPREARISELRVA
jgi:putative transposase